MHHTNTLLVAALTTALAAARIASAQTVETIFTLPDTGTQCYNTLVKTPSGSFLGAASVGGMAGFGTIFKVTPQGEVTRLISFNGVNGVFPETTLIAGSDGKFYGLTRGGGSNGDFGVAYRISDTGGYEKLVDFNNNLSQPSGRLLLASDGNFYGIASSPGPGAIFKLTPSKQLSALHRFSNDSAALDGVFPVDGLVEQEDGSLLGVTSGGGTNNKGTVFKLTKAGQLTKLADFTGTNGSTPHAGLTKGSDGNFYGATAFGGTFDCGVFFKVAANGTYSAIASFDPTIGIQPEGRPIEVSGTLYGVTNLGTTGTGSIYEITPGDLTPALAKVVELIPESGRTAFGGLILGDDNALYGVTSRGGGGDAGAIFKVTTGGTLTKVGDLSAPQGQQLSGGLVAGPSNVLFGAAAFGGTKNAGTIFQVTAAGAFTKLADVDPELFGRGVFSPLFLGSDQKLYGVTSPTAHLFTSTTTGTLSSLATFDALAIPNGFIEASDGIFYGTASNGGGMAKVFKYTSANGLQELATIPTSLGDSPLSKLVEGADGDLYGTSATGGANQKGSAFRVTKAGVVSLFASFSDSIGSGPIGPLLLAGDGNFYGLASRGGTNGIGTVYRIAPDGKVSRVAAFNGFNGAFPQGGLVEGAGGNLYGTAQYGGGAGKFGTVFKVSKSGAITTLQTFDAKTNGAYPNSTLARSSDGSLYGTTYSTIFRIAIVNHPPVAKNDTFVLPVIRKNVIANDSDPDKDPLSIVSVTDGMHGTVEFTEDGSVTYLPNPDFDTATVTTDSFTYTISDGLVTATATVTVSVPPDLVRAGAGAYAGLLTRQPDGSPQGNWGLVMTGPGIFTGALLLDGVKTPIKGVFEANGTYTATKTRKPPLPPLTINLQLDTIKNEITGTVSDGSTTYGITLVRKLKIYSSQLPTPRAGRYTLVLRPTGAASFLPAGSGFAAMTVSPKGAIAIVGQLGDGTPFAVGSFLAADESFPLYAGVYKKSSGYVAGLVQFVKSQVNFAGGLTWKKPPQDGDALYPAGFDTSINASGIPYASKNPAITELEPPDGSAANAELIFGPGETTRNLLTISPNNSVVVLLPNEQKDKTTKLSIIGKTGLFKGTYLIGKKAFPFGGAIFQGTSISEGLYRNETGTEKVLLYAF